MEKNYYKIKRLIILIKKFTPDTIFIIVFAYVICNPGKLGTWVGEFLKNVNLIINK